jgi:sugar phosphate permease
MTSISGAAERSGWYYGWKIVVVCVLSQIAVYGVPINALSLFLRPWSVELHVPISRILLFGFGGYGTVYALVSPIVGFCSDKYPSRRLFSAGLAGMAVFCLAISFVNAAWQLLVLFAILLPIALCFSAAVPSNSVVSRWFVRRRGLALGLTAFGLSMGGIVVPPIIAQVAPEFGWRAIWRFTGIVIAVIVAPVVIWVLRDRPTAREGLHYVTGGPSKPLHDAPSSPSSLGWRDVLARRNFWILVITYLPLLASYLAGAQNLALIAASHGLSQQTAGALLSAFAISHLTATLVVGLLSDRFGNRLPLAALALATAAGGAITALGQTGPAIVLGTVLIGAAGGLWPLLAGAAAIEFGGSGVGRAFGLLMFFLPVPIFAPYAVARIQEVTGSYAPGLIGLAAITLLGGIVCLFMREKTSGRAKPTVSSDDVKKSSADLEP